MPDKIVLESPVFDVESALKANQYGVDRLELCSSYYEGGLTPGPGVFSFLKSKIEIPIFVMIRPRGGHFVSSDEEIEVMKEEISIFSSLGANGFVFGILKKDGSVHKQACKMLVENADGKPCTFHRAFDVSSNLNQSLEDIIDCGFHRILSSGGENSVGEGLSAIKKMLIQANDRIIIMPGGGMTPKFVAPLRDTGYLKEVHASCKIHLLTKGSSIEEGNIQAGIQLSVSRGKVERFKEVF